MPRIKKLTDYSYSPTNPSSEDAIRLQIDDAIQEVYDASAKNTDTVNLTGNQTVGGIKTLTDGIKVPVASAADNPIRKDTFETHKTSSDHDGRYPTESEVNALLLANQQGNHTGTWQGLTPTLADPGIAMIVEGHTQQFLDNVKLVKPTGQLDDTSYIQSVLNIYPNIRFLPGIYKINAVISLAVSSDRNIYLDEGAVFEVITNNSTTYRVFLLNNVENVTIDGGKITGDKYTHTGVTGEFGHGIYIAGCNNVKIKNMTIEKCWGDGIVVTGSVLNGASTNITFENITADNNRRQGLTVGGVDGLTAINCKFTNTGTDFGTAPMYGVDIETDSGDAYGAKNIKFVACTADNNMGGGYNITNPITGTALENILFSGCTSKNNAEHGFKSTGYVINLKIDSCTASSNGYDGIKIQGPSGVSLAKRINVNNNDCSLNGYSGIEFSRYVEFSEIKGNLVFENDMHGIYVNTERVDDLIISENICHSNSQATNITYDNILIDSSCHRNLVANNIIRKGSLINKPRYGININANENNIVINNDVYIGGETANIVIAGVTNSHRNNRGYKTETKLISTSIDVSTTGNKEFSFNHGLAFAPSLENCIPFFITDGFEAALTIQYLLIKEVTSTTVTVRFLVSVAGGAGAKIKVGLNIASPFVE